ncbi:hypothetical protein LguiA_005094 [Lonicera macranthoides]
MGEVGQPQPYLPKSKGKSNPQPHIQSPPKETLAKKWRRRRKRDENSTSGGGGGDGMVTAECTVCLEIYMEGEKCKVLPKCGHIFHAACVDTWLRRNRGDRPLCRTRVLE